MKRFLFITVPAILVAVAFSEIFLRLWWDDKSASGGGAPNLVWIKRHVRENALGLRGQLPAIEKPHGTFRIVALGDSTTYGKGIELEGNRWPELLAEMLSKRLGARVDAINLSYPAWDTVEERQALVENGFKFHPDIVILGYNYNDPENATQRLEITGRARGPAWLLFLRERFYIADFAYQQVMRPRNNEMFRQYIHRISSPDAPNLPEFKQAMAGIRDDCKKAGVDFAVVIFPTLTGINKNPYEFQDAEDLITVELKGLGVPYVSLLPLLKGYEGRELWASPYDPHPDEKVHKMAAEQLLPLVEPIIKSRLDKQ